MFSIRFVTQLDVGQPLSKKKKKKGKKKEAHVSSYKSTRPLHIVKKKKKKTVINEVKCRLTRLNKKKLKKKI